MYYILCNQNVWFSRYITTGYAFPVTDVNDYIIFVYLVISNSYQSYIIQYITAMGLYINKEYHEKI